MSAKQPTAYSNIEILNLVVMALMNGRDNDSDPIIAKSWTALDDAFERGRRQGYKEGFNAGLSAAGQSEAAAARVIETICRRVDR